MAATTEESVKNEPAIPAESAVEEESFPLTLEEYCSRLSTNDKRVELIGGFHHTERAAGHEKDTEAAFHRRFVAFTKLPA